MLQYTHGPAHSMHVNPTSNAVDIDYSVTQMAMPSLECNVIPGHVWMLLYMGSIHFFLIIKCTQSKKRPTVCLFVTARVLHRSWINQNGSVKLKMNDFKMTHCFVITQFHLIGRVNLPQHSMVHVDESHSWPLLATRGDPPINSAHRRIRKRLKSNWMIQSGERTWQFTFISPSSWILYYNLWRPKEATIASPSSNGDLL